MPLSNFIGNEDQDPRTKSYLPLYDPSTGFQYGEVPASGEADVEAAVQAAHAAFPAWAATPAHERSRILARIADETERQADMLRFAESKDTGKPVWLTTRMDIPRAVENFRFFSGAAAQFASESHETHPGVINYTLRQPLGVVACISPWNLPLYLFTWKIAPALAAGNTVVAKPSELTPYTAWLFGDICRAAGLPSGVLNIVHGTGSAVGGPLTTHPLVKAISFTGSTRTGAEIARNAAPLFKKISLEMGGKNPAIVFADCDYEAALDALLRASFTNQGQICLCSSRILVERSLYERFKRDFVERTRAMQVGPPIDSDSRLGAVVSEGHLQKILSYIALAQSEGGRVLCGGERVYLSDLYAKGWYVAPTVIEALGPDARCNREEIFGPVVTLMPFDTEEEALRLANQSDYGLSATIWTQHLQRAHRFARQIEAGIVWVNTWLLRDLRTPFGGMKHSGVGREGGWEAMRFFTEAKNVCIQYG